MSKIQKEFANYPSATIASFVPPAISGLGMFGGFEYQLLDKGDRTPQELYDEAVKLMQKSSIKNPLNFMFIFIYGKSSSIKIDVDASKAMAQGCSFNEMYNAIASYFGNLM